MLSAISIVTGNSKFKVVIGKYIEIFSDPFFWLMTAIAFGMGFWVYRKYVIGNPGVSEEADLLQVRLAQKGYTYLSSEIMNPNGNAAAELLPPNSAGTAGNGSIYTYRTVKAATAKGEPAAFTARFEYRNAALVAVNFEPELQETTPA